MSATPGSTDHLGVAIVHWPAEADRLVELASAGIPRLVVVDPLDHPPGSSDCSQDWVWQHTPRQEKHLRLRQLLQRARAHNTLRPHVDEYGILTFGEASVPLSEMERRIASVLIENFDRPVSRTDLGVAGWGEPDPGRSKFSSRLHRLRGHIHPLGLDIQRTPLGYRMVRS